MAKAKKTDKVKLITGMISNDLSLFDSVQKIIYKKFGGIDLSGEIIDFNYTDYYDEEMGDNLKRKFLSFENLVLPDTISNVKLFTNEIENKFLDSKGGRRINIDPGYVSAAKLVLASTKNFFHRIYLRDGIYAEITLSYKDDSFTNFDWTFPDYRTQEYIDFFNKVRNKYMRQIKHRG